MEAVSRGAKEAGGSTIGVTTEWFASLTANPWVDEEVRTATFIERLQTIIEIGQGYLALKGGVGTLTEISTVWSLLQTHSIPRRPFVLLVEPWQSLLDFCRAELIIRDSDYNFLRLARTADEAVHALVQDVGAQGR
jgi:predicted Rossmann-fold nucleotide-binding protein